MHTPSPPSNSTQLEATAAAVASSAPSRLEELRKLVAENDREAVRLLNRRLELVADIWREKDTNGLPQVDAERERRLLDHLVETNEGPLSEAGLGLFHGLLLALTKQELDR